MADEWRLIARAFIQQWTPLTDRLQRSAAGQPAYWRYVLGNGAGSVLFEQHQNSIRHSVILQPIKTKETNEFMICFTLKTLHMTWWTSGESNYWCSRTNSPASVDDSEICSALFYISQDTGQSGNQVSVCKTSDILEKDFFLIERNGYETRQSSLLYVFVRFFGLVRTQNTIVVYSLVRN